MCLLLNFGFHRCKHKEGHEEITELLFNKLIIFIWLGDKRKLFQWVPNFFISLIESCII